MNPEERQNTEGSPSLSPNQAPSPLKQIRTFQGDVAEALKSQHESLVSIQAKEAQKRKDEIRHEIEKAAPPPPPAPTRPQGTPDLPVIAVPARKTPIEHPEPIIQETPQQAETPVREVPFFTPEELAARKKRRQGMLLALGILLLLGGGAYGAWSAYTKYKEKSALPMVEIIPNSFISVDSRSDHNALTFTREKLIEIVRDEKNKAGKGIIQIELRKGETTTASFLTSDQFFTLLQTEAPGRLVRAFDPLFMLGVIGDTTPRHVFMLIKLDSFENAFSGMFAWEETMIKDFLPLFTSDEVVSRMTSQGTWSDITIKNKDARVLKDSTGHTVLLYSFVDNTYLLITDNEDTFRTLLARIEAEKLVR